MSCTRSSPRPSHCPARRAARRSEPRRCASTSPTAVSARRSRFPHAGRGCGAVDEPALPDEGAAIAAALRSPLAGAPLSPNCSSARDRRRGVPHGSEAPPRAELHRPSPLAGRAGSRGRARRPRHAPLCATGDTPAGDSCPRSRSGRAPTSSPARLHVDHDAQQVTPMYAGRRRGRARQSSYSVSTWRRTHASSPGSSSRTSSQASVGARRQCVPAWRPRRRSSLRHTTPAASPATVGHVRHEGGQPGARLRTCGDGAGATDAVARCRHQPGAAGDSGLRRAAARCARRRLRTREGRLWCCCEVGAPFDLVVSTNGGYPLDRNLYQAVKGMAAAERIVRERGHCDHGCRVRRRGAGRGCLRPPAGSGGLTPAGLAQRVGWPKLDRWQAQVLGRSVGARRGPAPQRRPRRRHRRRRLPHAGRGPRCLGVEGGARPPRCPRPCSAMIPEGPSPVATIVAQRPVTRRRTTRVPGPSTSAADVRT